MPGYPPAGDALRVPRAGTLRAASFRFPLAGDTLAVRLTIPITRARRGLPPPSIPLRYHTSTGMRILRCTPCLAHHHEKGRAIFDPAFIDPDFFVFSPSLLSSLRNVCGAGVFSPCVDCDLEPISNIQVGRIKMARSIRDTHHRPAVKPFTPLLGIIVDFAICLIGRPSAIFARQVIYRPFHEHCWV